MNGDKHFVVCVKNDEYEGALELRKIYEVLDDRDAEPHEMIRVSTSLARTTSIRATGSSRSTCRRIWKTSSSRSPIATPRRIPAPIAKLFKRE